MTTTTTTTAPQGEWRHLMRSDVSHFIRLDSTYACTGKRVWNDDLGWEVHRATDWKCERCEARVELKKKRRR